MVLFAYAANMFQLSWSEYTATLGCGLFLLETIARARAPLD